MASNQSIRNLRSDWRANRRDPKALFVVTGLRITQALMGSKPKPRFFSWPAIILYRFGTEFLLGMELRPKTTIGPGLTIFHGYGLVVNDHAVIGQNVVLRNGVTIGHQTPGGGAPVLGDGVELGAGAILIGNIRIGNNCTVGAGSVVTKSMPPNSVVAGNPARVLYLKGTISE